MWSLDIINKPVSYSFQACSELESQLNKAMAENVGLLLLQLRDGQHTVNLISVSASLTDA
jgi:hypothetical protein